MKFIIFMRFILKISNRKITRNSKRKQMRTKEVAFKFVYGWYPIWAATISCTSFCLLVQQFHHQMISTNSFKRCMYVILASVQASLRAHRLILGDQSHHPLKGGTFHLFREVFYSRNGNHKENKQNILVLSLLFSQFYLFFFLSIY